MNPIIRELLNINRPEYINVSGSIVLKQILINNNISHDWNSNDLDIYISLNDTTFNTIKCIDYIRDILVFLSQNTINQKEFVAGKVVEHAYDLCRIVAKNYINNHNNIIAINNNENDEYMSTSTNILDVIKLHYDNIHIDFIFINIDIENYIKKNFDLSIIQNYIDNKNKIVQFNDINNIKKLISNINLVKWEYILSHQSVGNIYKFIERVHKYNTRGFNIYLNYLKCSCNIINCLCTIKLDYEFINIFNQGYINFNNIVCGFVDLCLNKKYCYKKKNHIGICKGNYHDNSNFCNKEISYLRINDYKSLPSSVELSIKNAHRNLEGNPIIIITILNKIVLHRELLTTYSLHPNNLLKLFDDLLD